MQTSTLDLKQLRDVTDCPVCHASGTFRPMGVMGQYWVIRCTKCRHYKSWPLPRITKKIIYLDQLVISNLVKATQPFWSELYKKLATLSSLQLIVCPHSEIHRDESLLSYELRQQLRDMYRLLGCSVQFRAVNNVEQDQLLTAIRRWLGVVESNSQTEWREAFERDPHAWATGPQVFADFPPHEPWVTDLRNRKHSLHMDLECVRRSWLEEDHKFNDDVQREARAYGQALIATYRELANGQQQIESLIPDELKDLFRACLGPDSFNPHIPPGIQPGVRLVHCLAVEVHKARPNEYDPVALVEQFLQTDEAANVRFQYISCRLWAAIAQRVRNPKGPRQSKPSDSFDIKAIATFAPYCDAMFVDNEFREMASQGNVDVPGKFGVRLFSMKTRDEFIAYLDDLWDDISDAHRGGLPLIFPHLEPILPLIGRKKTSP